MKKILILAYDFPPYVSVGGLRPYNWFKYFKEYDIEPTVVTRQWQNLHGNELDYVERGSSNEMEVETNEYGTILRTPYEPNLSNRLLLKYGENRFKFTRKAISAFYEIFQFWLPLGPKYNLLKYARIYLKQEKVDAIIATGDPFVLFKYASQLSKEFQIPWIADYRDPWSHNISTNQKLIKKLNQHLERKYIQNAKFITTVSEFVANKIEELNPDKNIQLLPNGYDPQLIEEANSISQNSDCLNIGFVGTIYPWHPLKSFLRVCNEIVISNPQEFKLNFYGTNYESELKQLIDSEFISLKGKVQIFGRLPNKNVLEKLAANNLLLLFNYYSFMGTKIFDYLGVKRKIILCYENDEEANFLKRQYYNIEENKRFSNQLQADLIRETNSGIVIKNAVELKFVLLNFLNEFEQKRMIACDSLGVEKYSRKIQVKKLAELIHSNF